MLRLVLQCLEILAGAYSEQMARSLTAQLKQSFLTAAEEASKQGDFFQMAFFNKTGGGNAGSTTSGAEDDSKNDDRLALLLVLRHLLQQEQNDRAGRGGAGRKNPLRKLPSVLAVLVREQREMVSLSRNTADLRLRQCLIKNVGHLHRTLYR